MDKNNLERFLIGQDFGYDCALQEIKNGRKVNHWIWYIFPQLRGLGHSPNSDFYGIAGLDEAKAYLAHPVLGQRLREITAALLTHKGTPIQQIMPGIDAIKLKSSMTLFNAASPDDIFKDVLDSFFDGKADEASLLCWYYLDLKVSFNASKDEILNLGSTLDNIAARIEYKKFCKHINIDDLI